MVCTVFPQIYFKPFKNVLQKIFSLVLQYLLPIVLITKKTKIFLKDIKDRYNHTK